MGRRRSEGKRLSGRDDSVPAKIAFVVDADKDGRLGHEPGQEIRFVSVSLDGKTWGPLYPCEKQDREYWRRVFLLIAEYYERWRVLGPPRRWPREGRYPVIIHGRDRNYEHWRFLAEYWYAKRWDIGIVRTPRATEETKRLRMDQKALAHLFRAGGTRKGFPWITIHGKLAPGSILFCPVDLIEAEISNATALPRRRSETMGRKKDVGSIAFGEVNKLRPACLKRPGEVPKGLFKKCRFPDIAALPNIVRQLKERIREDEFQKGYWRRSGRSWMGAYKGALLSQVPECPVDLTFRERVTKTDPRSGRDTTEASNPIQPWQRILAPDFAQKRLLITGPAGAGKSTLLRLIAKDFLPNAESASSDRLPVLVMLNRFTPGIHTSFQQLVLDSIHRLLEISGTTLDPKAESNLKKWLNSDKWRGPDTVHFLDGYNEILYEHRFGAGGFEELLTRFLTEHQGSTVITTQGEECPPCFVAKTIVLQELSDDAIEQYVAARLPDAVCASLTTQLLHDPKYQPLARNPYFLVLLVNLALKTETKNAGPSSIELPASRSAVLSAIVKTSLDRKFRVEGVRRPVPSVPDSLIISVLARLAHDSLKTPSRRPQFPDCLNTISQEPHVGCGFLRTAVLAGFLEHLDLDSLAVNRPVTFSHDLLRDYFAALHIATRIPKETVNLRTDYLEFHRWDESLCLFAEMCDDDHVFETIANQIAQEDLFFATQFALRRTRLSPQVILSLVRGHGYWAEQFYLAVYGSNLGYGTFSTGAPFQCLSNRSATTLLSRLELSQLFRAHKALPDGCWLLSNVVSAIAMRGRASWEQAIKDSRFEGYREQAFLLEGLSYLGSSDALLQAADIARSVTDSPPAHGGEEPFFRAFFILKCKSMFSGWNTNVPPDQVLALITGQENAQMRASFLPLLEKARFQTRHIAQLWGLASVNDPDSARPVLRAIGRIGGQAAINAILDFAEEFLRAHGDIGTSETTGGNIYIIFEALAWTTDRYLALDRLKKVLGCQTEKQVKDSRRTRSRGTGENVDLDWNRILLHVLSRAREVDRLYRFFVPHAVDREILQDLQNVMQNHPSPKVCREAERSLARIRCLQNPERTLEQIADMAERQPVKYVDSDDINEPVNGVDWLPMWGLNRIAEVMMHIGFNVTETLIKKLSRLAENKNVFHSLRMGCVQGLLFWGIRVHSDLITEMLYSISIRPDEIDEATEDFAGRLGIYLSDNEICYIANEIKTAVETCDPGKPRDIKSEICGRLLGKLFLGPRDRRYLQALGSWPSGLRVVPQADEPFGFDELVRVITGNQASNDEEAGG